MIYLKANNKKVSIPTSYKEMSWGLFKKIAECNNDAEVCAVLLRMDIEEFMDYHKVQNVKLVLDSIYFMRERPEKIKPHSVKIYGINIPIGHDLNDIKAGQFFDMKSTIESQAGMNEIMTELVAIYLQPKFNDNIYNYEKVEALKKEVDKMSSLSVLGLADFFLMLWAGSKNGIPRTANMSITTDGKGWQVFRNLRDLALRIYYRHWYPILGFVGKRFSAK